MTPPLDRQPTDAQRTCVANFSNGASAKTSAKISPHWSPWLWWPSSPCSPTVWLEDRYSEAPPPSFTAPIFPMTMSYIECRVLHRLAHLVPGLIFYHLGPMALEGHPVSVKIIQTAAHIYLVLSGLLGR